jgi:hypothetical protein
VSRARTLPAENCVLRNGLGARHGGVSTTEALVAVGTHGATRSSNSRRERHLMRHQPRFGAAARQDLIRSPRANRRGL